jgi:hypothetical protein
MATTVSTQPTPVAAMGVVGQPDPNVTYLGSLHPPPEPQLVGSVVVAPQDLTGQTITNQPPSSSVGWTAFAIFVFCIILVAVLYFVTHRQTGAEVPPAAI